MAKRRTPVLNVHSEYKPGGNIENKDKMVMGSLPHFHPMYHILYWLLPITGFPSACHWYPEESISIRLWILRGTAPSSQFIIFTSKFFFFWHWSLFSYYWDFSYVRVVHAESISKVHTDVDDNFPFSFLK